jgi:hypothetical protein
MPSHSIKKLQITMELQKYDLFIHLDQSVMYLTSTITLRELFVAVIISGCSARRAFKARPVPTAPNAHRSYGHNNIANSTFGLADLT